MINRGFVFLVVYGGIGIVLIAMPFVFLFSSRSPLRSLDAQYITAYVFGIASVFFPLLGGLLVMGAIKGSRRLSSRPAR